MNRTAKLAVAVAGLVGAGVAVALIGGGHSATGAVELAVKMPPSARLASIERTISGNGITPLTGSIGVAGSPTAGEVVGGIPAGEGYAVELEAAGANGGATCTGAADLDVVEGKTVHVTVIMQCSDTKAAEGVTANGRPNRCPVITSVGAAPSPGLVNGTVALRAKGTDADGDRVTFQWVQHGADTTEGKKLGALDPKVNAVDSRSASTVFRCAGVGTGALTVIASDGTCNDTSTLTVSCALTPAEPPPAGTASAITAQAGPHTGAGQATQPAAPGAAPLGASGAPRAQAGALLAAGAEGAALGGAGQGGAAQSGSTTPIVPHAGAGMPDGGSPAALCQLCAFGPATSPLCGTALPQGCANCNAGTDGCDDLADEEEKELCEAALNCFMGHASGCVVQGDPLRCWCGTNPTTCVTSNDGATRANGICLAEVFAAARSEDAATIKQRFVDAKSALGRAVLITQCLGSFCSKECSVP